MKQQLNFNFVAEILLFIRILYKNNKLKDNLYFLKKILISPQKKKTKRKEKKKRNERK